MKNKGNIFVICFILCLLFGCGKNDGQTMEASETISIIEGTYIVRAEDREKEVLENTDDVENTEPIEDTEKIPTENIENIDDSDSDEKENDEPVEEKTESEKQPEQPPAPVHTHAYSEAITANPTCTSNGVKKFTCSCGHSYTEAIAATGHHYNNSVTTNPTCTTAGVRTYTCGCGSSYTEAIPALGAANHEKYNLCVNFIKEATCTEEGLWEYYCDFCGYSYTEARAIIPHNWVHVTTTNNLTGEVIEDYYYCNMCNIRK